MEHEEILHRCFRCGYCKLPGSYVDINCPSYLKFRFESYSPGGRMWLLRAWLDGEIKTSPRLAQILYSCAACANCVEHCVFPKFKDDLLDAFLAGREALVAEGMMPPAARDCLKALQTHGNPYKRADAERADWAEGLDLEPYKAQEYLLHVGCVGAFDERGRKTARAVAGALKEAGVSFGLLGAEERCEGDEARVLGERGLFERIARENIRRLEEASIKKVVALSPHAYHAFKNEYPKLGGNFQVFHYTQLLGLLIGKLKADPDAGPLKATFHDPCYLGRHNGEYSAPRKILKGLRGVQLVEMDRNKADALCCGGGGGNFFTDALGPGVDSPARTRVRDAAAMGVEAVAAACPQCAKMLEDAVKAEFLEDRLQVMDLAEIVLSRLLPS